MNYFFFNSYYHSSTAPSCFKRYIPRLPFDTSRIKGGMLGRKFFFLFLFYYHYLTF
jgi:hypothetical protein